MAVAVGTGPGNQLVVAVSTDFAGWAGGYGSDSGETNCRRVGTDG